MVQKSVVSTGIRDGFYCRCFVWLCGCAFGRHMFTNAILYNSRRHSRIPLLEEAAVKLLSRDREAKLEQETAAGI
jgi:hypothetical protein